MMDFTSADAADAVEDMTEINAYYQDMEIILGNRLNEQLSDGSVLTRLFSPFEMTERLRKINAEIGKITARWV